MTGPTTYRRPTTAALARGNSVYAPIAVAAPRAPSAPAAARDEATAQAALDLEQHKARSKAKLVERLAQELAATHPDDWTKRIDELDKVYRRSCRQRWPGIDETKLEESSARLWSVVLERLDALMAASRRAAGAA